MTGTDAIVVKDVGKKFRLRHSGGRSLKSAALDLLRFGNRGNRDFWALKDVNFTVAEGEAVGIIGANGAGKSTLLSLLARTKVPTTGTVDVRGSVSSLLELGAGFHPDLTGRENVFLSGAVMGLTRKQMKERFDSIVEFAGIAEFIDQPVKHYSSGMYVRLGFAVAVEVNPDILLVDEVLAVGDLDFQRKCLRRMNEFKDNGKTMLIISHDIGIIQKMSDRILLLDSGSVMGMGVPGEVVEQYQALSRNKAAAGMGKEWGTGELRFTDVALFGEDGARRDSFRWGETLEARISYEASHRIDDPVFGFSIADEGGEVIYGNNSQIEGTEIPFIEGNGRVSLFIKGLSLAGGRYLLSFSAHSSDHKTNYHRLDNAFPITILSEKITEGSCYMPCRWEVG